ncbi:MAG: hypothetical protein JNK37_12260 [Verrucomicrobiales bacterium]|nr:hypothetical protein [Verrucomicrobiales bacterium]
MKLPSLRALTALYHLDQPFARIAKVTGVLLVASVTVGWVALQMDALVTDETAGIDTGALRWATAAGHALVGLGLGLLILRYRWIRRAVTHGKVIQGIVQQIIVRTSRLPAEKHAPWTPRLSHTHFAVVAYEAGGVTRQVRLKLPAGATVSESGEVELLVLPDAPGRALLRNGFQSWARFHC